MCPNTEFFWSVFSRIRTEYREILRISPYSFRMRENTDQKKFRIWTHSTQCNIQIRTNYYVKYTWMQNLPGQYITVIIYCNIQTV